MKKLLHLSLLVFLTALLSACAPSKPVVATDYLDRGFTPWIPSAQLPDYFAPLDKKDEEGKNYWDRHHWVTAVQGRWHDGGPQFRFRLESAPADGKYGWYWYFNMDKEPFHDRLVDFSQKNFKLVYQNSYEWPDGSRRYSGVWQKVNKK